MKNILISIFTIFSLLVQSPHLLAKSTNITYFQILFENNKATLTDNGDSALKILIEDLKNYDFTSVNLIIGTNFHETKVDKDLPFKRIQLILDSLKAYTINLNRVFVDFYSPKKNNESQGVGVSLTSRVTNFEISDTIIFDSDHFCSKKIIDKSRNTIGKFILENQIEFDFNHSIQINVCSNESLKDRIRKAYSIKKLLSKNYNIHSKCITISCNNLQSERNKILIGAW